MTVKLRLPWHKRESVHKLAQHPPEVACTPQPPPSPRDACNYNGHIYRPIANNRTHVLVFCERCADAQRIFIAVPKTTPPPQPRFRPAHIA